MFLGHSRNDGGAGVPESLRAHLSRVAARAAHFAAAFGAAQQAARMCFSSVGRSKLARYVLRLLTIQLKWL